MIDIEQHENSAIGALLAIAMIIIGAAAIIVKAMDLAADDKFTNVVGVLIVICGLLMIFRSATTDGPRDALFGGCMFTLIGFVMAMSASPTFILYWLTVIVMAEMGLKIFFMMPTHIMRVNLGSDVANKAVGIALVVAAIAMIFLEGDGWKFYLYLVGALLMFFGVLYLAQHQGKGDVLAIE